MDSKMTALLEYLNLFTVFVLALSPHSRWRNDVGKVRYEATDCVV